MRAIRTTSAVALILAAACTGGAPDATGASDPGVAGFSETDTLQPDGPLRGVAFTGHVDREDPKIRPTFAFTTKDTEVTAVIGLGDVGEGSTLVVTWYRVAGSDQREELFSQEIAVGPGGRAFSQAVAPNGLAPGIYDTGARLDGHAVHTPLVVREAGGSETGATAQAASGDEDWDVPESGDSWWDDGSEQPPQQGTSIDTCTFNSINGGMTPIVDVQASAWLLGPCTTGTLTATVSGAPTTIASSDSLKGPISSLYGATWVCGLSGGTDMPGTVVHFEVTGSASGSADYTLPDYGKTLTAALEGKPESGGKVEPGDRIDILALAMVMAPALGVKTLYVDDGSDLLESVGNLSGSPEMQECDPRRFYAALRTTYEVPSDPPPVIELCATGVGFDGTESKDCISYYTGEVWTGSGTFTSSATYPDGSTCKDAVEIGYTFGVAGDGAIEGTGVAKHTKEAQCPFPTPGAQWESQSLSLSGQRDGQNLSLTFGLSGAVEPADGIDYGGFETSLALGSAAVALTVQGTSAEGMAAFSSSSGDPPAVYAAEGTLQAKCVASCAPAS